MTAESVDALQRWHQAVNAGDVEAAVAECTEDVAVRGPRGTGYGHQLVRDWLNRSGIRLEPLEAPVERDGRYVIRETARWTTTDAEPVETFCVFTVSGAKISSIARYDDVSEVPPSGQPAGTSSS